MISLATGCIRKISYDTTICSIRGPYPEEPVPANAIWLISKKENGFAGAGVMIYEGHKVISSGPYELVRHPNYVGDLTLMIGIPLALGSWWGLVIFALVIPAMV
jgi:protein-S-isoprenylcysteine O-methyltransferase Ste14